VAETGAIIEQYLLETRTRVNGLTPPRRGAEAARRFTYWLHYAEGSAMTPLLLKLVFGALPKRSPGLIKPIVNAISSKAQSSFIDPQIEAHSAYWEGELSKAQWFAGDQFTAADIMMSFPLEAGGSRALGPDKPRLQAFLDASTRGRPISGRWSGAGPTLRLKARLRSKGVAARDWSRASQPPPERTR
jgi:glutathione S-transferase